MSTDFEIEEIIQSNLHLIEHYLIDKASKHFLAPIDEIQIIETITKQKIGETGQVLISTVLYDTALGPTSTQVAFKYFESVANLMAEVKNSIELDVLFKTSPEFGTPKLLFASTRDPPLVIYEGLDAVNYDELEFEGKAKFAGRLLAEVHQPICKNINFEVYKSFSRQLANRYESVDLETKISHAMGRLTDRIEHMSSGGNPFNDFHQSNLMMSVFDEQVSKTYLLDPEFMSKESFDRMEDIGVFFGQQLLNEYISTGDVVEGVKDVHEFLKAYEEKNIENGGMEWRSIYKNGNPLIFYLGIWLLMDNEHKAAQLYDGDITHPDILKRVEFLLWIEEKDPFNFHFE